MFKKFGLHNERSNVLQTRTGVKAMTLMAPLKYATSFTMEIPDQLWNWVFVTRSCAETQTILKCSIAMSLPNTHAGVYILLTET